VRRQNAWSWRRGRHRKVIRQEQVPSKRPENALICNGTRHVRRWWTVTQGRLRTAVLVCSFGSKIASRFYRGRAWSLFTIFSAIEPEMRDERTASWY